MLEVRGARPVAGDDGPAVGQFAAAARPRVSIGSMASAMPGDEPEALAARALVGHERRPCAWPCRCRGRRSPTPNRIGGRRSRRTASSDVSIAQDTSPSRPPARAAAIPAHMAVLGRVDQVDLRPASDRAPPRAPRSPSRSASRPGRSRHRWTAGRRPARTRSRDGMPCTISSLTDAQMVAGKATGRRPALRRSPGSC